MRRISNVHKILFFKRLALYLNSGISLPVACNNLAKETTSHGARGLLIKVEQKILTGEPLSKVLKEYPKEFDAFICALLTIGETSGSLPHALLQIAELLQKRESLRKKVQSAALYPLIIVLGTFGITCFLLFYIFPKILPVFAALRVKLPVTTRILIYADTFVVKHWQLLCVIGIILAALSLWVLHSKLGRKYIELLILHTPIARSLYSSYFLSLLFSMLKIQLESGISIVLTLDLLETSLPESKYKSSIVHIRKNINEGRTLSSSLAKDSLFPKVASELIAAGENTGTLGKNCEYLGELFEERLDYLTKNLTTLLEPCLMVGVGIVVGFIALAIITPIYQVTQSLTTQ